LFRRAIIQSGSAFSYWGLDALPAQRYHSFRTFFNCTHLPTEATVKNRGFTRLISECLTNINTDILYSFNFGLIDAPGPVYDGFMNDESIIGYRSAKECVLAQKNIPVDIMTGINGLEGFSFEGKLIY